ncbi:hypothetical protein TRIATDRAFT_81264 [Trichoderma atroviride IMI 206040]|uniref:Uncharacterized protein n=1 Tax=Hypocrea atroviridis (strain ATCC 20476 / IMI 206040) TaxID=452589 RepID=G9NGB8_HYPAI|nr:uncharacterized protein TRIATDRAFT_81264 [Trichoderma atroviride IMI 206040]EHK50330.1 hypothetical protein TRIATDRAFT_81264 [Trichoderma atroviride IMI 206040]
MANSGTPANTLAVIQLLVTTFATIRDVTRLLRTEEIDNELKAFYANVNANCTLMTRDWSRISKSAYGIDEDLVSRTLSHLGSIITTSSLKPLQGSISSATCYGGMRAFNQEWNLIQKQSDKSMRIQHVRSCTNFGKTLEERNRFIQRLNEYEDELQARYPDFQPDWISEDLLIKKSIRQPSYAVWNAAQSIFKALVACSDCECTPSHEMWAQLGLGTYRKASLNEEIDMDSGLDFDMFLSIKQDWQEAHILMSEEVKERAVVFQDDSEVKKPQTRKSIAKTKQMRVKRLCEPIAKMRTMAAHRLELKVMRDQLFKLRSERSTSLVDTTRSPITLEQFLKIGSRSFTERTRRILAVILSYAVLYLHDTPWLQHTWSSSHILFFPTTSSAIPLRPFIQIQLGQYQESRQDPDDLDDPDDLELENLDPDDLIMHHCPFLVTLAVMLMEVYFAVPFNVLAKRYGYDIAPDAESSVSTRRCVDVELVFKACREEIPENYQFHCAVDKCLDPAAWEDESGNKLDNEALTLRIYQEIVLPLETELGQAFTSMPIDELDRIAQELNFPNWDQDDVYEKFIKPSSLNAVSSVKIAILDTGVDLSHPDFEARVDNIKGKYNWLSPNSNKPHVITDRNGHGTFAASLILDYAPDAQLYIAKIAESEPSSAGIIAKAINHAVSTWEVDIISMSFGFPTCNTADYHELEAALAHAHANRVLLFAAASNSGGKLGHAYPARDQHVIAIHSTDTNGNRSAFSPTAMDHDINLATVGEAVESAWPVYLSDETSNPNFVKYKSGTSYATPIAAGIAGFLLLYSRIYLPDKASALKNRQKMQALLRQIAEKERGQTVRDGYYFIDLSLYADCLFGKSLDFIDATIRNVLST